MSDNKEEAQMFGQASHEPLPQTAYKIKRGLIKQNENNLS